MFTLHAHTREASSSLSQLRKEGLMPAVMYGPKTESTPLSVSASEFLKVFAKAGESSVVTLVTDNGSFDTLIHEVDFDPLTSTPRHVDFYVFTKGQKIKVKIPVEFEGTAPATKAGAVIVKVMHEIEVEADPTHIPHALVVNLESLTEVGSQLTVKDISAPKGSVLVASDDEVLVLAALPKEEKEEAPVDFSAIEVEKKGKQEEAPAETE